MQLRNCAPGFEVPRRLEFSWQALSPSCPGTPLGALAQCVSLPPSDHMLQPTLPVSARCVALYVLTWLHKHAVVAHGHGGASTAGTAIVACQSARRGGCARCAVGRVAWHGMALALYLQWWW